MYRALFEAYTRNLVRNPLIIANLTLAVEWTNWPLYIGEALGAF
jgi:hypothetical protein